VGITTQRRTSLKGSSYVRRNQESEYPKLIRASWRKGELKQRIQELERENGVGRGMEVFEAVGIEGTIITKCCNLSDQVEKELKLPPPPSLKKFVAQLSWLNRLSLFRPNSTITFADPWSPDERGWVLDNLFS